MFWAIFSRKSALVEFIVYFSTIITKQGNKPEIDNLWRHPYEKLYVWCV